MKASKSHILSLFTSRTSLNRSAFLKGSLAASSSGIKRISSWSNSELKTQPFSMTFHAKWQDPECKVMKWYQLQAGSSTQLASIQHWRDLDEPFFHEYLIIQLVDGPVCRLERMGDGSRPNAILAGCAAHDIIQWFSSAENYKSNSCFQHPTELITEIQFLDSDRPDLIDVLAICYCIQRLNSTSNYTLQKFNCYFLCVTVLGIFSRLISLHQNSGRGASPEIVNAMIDKLRTIGHGDACNYLAFKFCSMLTLEEQLPEHFFYTLLRDSIETWSRDALSDVFKGIVWESTEIIVIKESLSVYVRASADTALANASANATILRNLSREEHSQDGDRKLAVQCSIPGGTRRKLLESGWSASKVAYDSYYQARLRENLGDQTRRRIVFAPILWVSNSLHFLSAFSLPVTVGPSTSAWVQLYKNSQDDALDRFGVGLGNVDITNRAVFTFFSTTLKKDTRSNCKQDPLDGRSINTLSPGSKSLLDYRIQARSEIFQAPVWDTREKQLFVLRHLFDSKIWKYCLVECVNRAVDDLGPLIYSGLIRARIVSYVNFFCFACILKILCT
ncbi:hypothetical protein ACGC1H_002665 [Rhizoctonia solani]